MEARPALVSGSVFKTDGAPRKRALGGFDSRALPLLIECLPSALRLLKVRDRRPSEDEVDPFDRDRI